MTAKTDALGEAARRIFADHCSRDTVDRAAAAGLDAALWSVLESTGLTLISVPEELGGSGGTLTEAATVLSLAAEHAAVVPLGQTDLEAGWLLAEAGMKVPAGPLSVVAEGLRDDGGCTVDLAAEVPWARTASWLVLVDTVGDREFVALVPAASDIVRPGANLAGEPRDMVRLRCAAGEFDVAEVAGGTARLARYRAALARSVMLAGAAQRALGTTVGYANLREQFGRPIGRLQAVQQQLAEMAAEAALMQAAAGAAVAAVEEHGMRDARALHAIAAAKGQCSQAATVVARVAHQVHGAIGVTYESDLRHTTTRLWSWRDEAGNEREWFGAAGRQALAAPSSVWAAITG